MLEGNSQLTRVRSPLSTRTTNDGALAGRPADRSIGRYPYSSIARRRRWHASSHGKGTVTALCSGVVRCGGAWRVAQTGAWPRRHTRGANVR